MRLAVFVMWCCHCSCVSSLRFLLYTMWSLVCNVGCYSYMFCVTICVGFFFFFSSRRRHTRFDCDWSSDVCSSDLAWMTTAAREALQRRAGLAAVALWEKQHGHFTAEEINEARRSVRAQLRTSR